VTSTLTRLQAPTSRLFSPRGFAIRRDGVNHPRRTAALLVFWTSRVFFPLSA
jgi:hypothetical protein